MQYAGAEIESKMFQFSTMQISALSFQVTHNARTYRLRIFYISYYQLIVLFLNRIEILSMFLNNLIALLINLLL
jgi:hypothetical protein